MAETVLLLGSGSREHAIAWKLLQSNRVNKIYVGPGNAGTQTLDERVVTIDLNIKDINEIINWCRNNKPNLVVVGPEDPLDRGVADELSVIGIPCFGPKRRAAKIECDKSFAKDFMKRHNIPTARYKNFSDANEAKDFIKNSEMNALVVKASGLAAGKGVIVAKNRDEACDAIDFILSKKSFGAAGDTVVVEELLEGDEVSVLAFTDGITFKTLLPSQDHKRAHDNDQGPNTGGMGAICPYPFLDEQTLKDIEREILQKTIDGLRQEGNPFTGLLYAGLMITRNGPKVIEFNCRFGDPETQSILPLLESDLYEICYACTQQNLKSIEIKWKNKSACGIVIASQGYPNDPIKGQLIEGLENATKGLLVFHGGTQYRDQKYLNCGGRILSVVAVDNDLKSAVDKAYKGVALIHIDNCFYRSDIGRKALNRLPKSLDYKSSGVDIIAGEELVNKIKRFASKTNRPGVVDQIGGFGALFDLKNANIKDPILVSGTDGVGTKLRVALECKRYNTVGIDLVAMCVNDILVQGAQPLYFLDYFACSKLEVETAALVIEGIAKGCYESNCALIGGETAEMPGMYAEDDFDLAGFAVGAVERENILPRINEINENDIVIGIPSSGVHSNGYSLVRKLIELKGIKYSDLTPFDSSLTFGDVLLEPTKLYVKPLLPVIQTSKVKALAHITGGGLIENIPRILPKDMAVVLDATKWKVYDIFKWIQKEGNISTHELLKTFNCGLGMICIVSKDNADSVLQLIKANGETAHIVGNVIKRRDESVIVNNFPKSVKTTTIEVPKKKRVAVLLSGSGTNFQAIVDYVNQNADKTSIDIVLVISDKKNAQGVIRAQKAGILTKVVIKKLSQTREEYDESINKLLLDHSIDIICLAGYMRIISHTFVNKWLGKMINIHPSILPLFKGLNAYQQALDAGVRITGCTVHFVTPEMDCGPIIGQKSVDIELNDTLEILQERGKRVEHQLYSQCLELMAQEKAILSDDTKKVIWKL